MARSGGRIGGRDFSPRPTGEPAPDSLSTWIGQVDTPWGFTVDFETQTYEASFDFMALPIPNFLNTKVSMGVNLDACVGWVRLEGNVFGIPNDGAFWTFPLDLPHCKKDPPKLKCEDYREPDVKCLDWVDYWVNGDPNLPPIDLLDVGTLIWYENGETFRYVVNEGGTETVFAYREMSAEAFYSNIEDYNFEISLEDWIAALRKEKKIELCHVAYACWRGTNYFNSVGEGGPGRLFGDCGKLKDQGGLTYETDYFWAVAYSPTIAERFIQDWWYQGSINTYTPIFNDKKWLIYGLQYISPPTFALITQPGANFDGRGDYTEYFCQTLFLKSEGFTPPPPQFALTRIEIEFFPDGSGYVYRDVFDSETLIPWGPTTPINFPPPSKVMPRKCCSCNDILRMLQPIYQILGKDKWVNGRYKFEPELMIRRLGKEAFDDKIVESKHVEVKDFMELISAIVAVNYFRSGYQELPAELPKTLFSYSDDEKLEKLGSYMEFFAWFIKQFDGLLGQWPIEIEIEDIDPTQAGDQTKKVQLPNISETLAELYGLLVDNTVNSDIAVSFLMRLSSEVIATKNSSLITQDYAKANADYLGYKGNPIKREINYAFNPSELDSLEKILSETTKKIIGWENQDKETVANYLQKLMFAAQIIKTVFYRTGSQEGLQELIQRLTKPDDVATDAEWERFMSRINNPQSEFNFGNNPEPKIRDKPGPTA